jgi:8-oxo-dGTP pyrophosphatase MutT (NUDIX family)
MLLAGLDVEADERDALDEIAAYLAGHTDAASRHSTGGAHITASSVLVAVDTGKTLLTLHPRFGRWMQLGGHFEPEDTSIIDAVLRETTEESGITDLTIDETPLGVGVFGNTPCPHGKTSTHYDIRFLVTTPGDSDAVISDESIELDWFDLDELPAPHDGDLERLARQARSRLTGRTGR